MPYVELRDGVIFGVYANPQPGYAEEFRADDDAEVVAFRNPPSITPQDNGEALDERQRETAKSEAAALWKAGKQEAAFNKLLELI